MRGLIIAARARTTFGRVMAGGLMLILFVYVFVNIGMVSGILPVVGVPLPLVSYGGSALIVLMARVWYRDVDTYPQKNVIKKRVKWMRCVMVKRWLGICVVAAILAGCSSDGDQQQVNQQPQPAVCNGPTVEISGAEPRFEPLSPSA